MLKSLKIARLKARARAAYLHREAIFDRLDCGRTMASQLPSYRAAEIEFQTAMTKLREIDPACPSAPTSEGG